MSGPLASFDCAWSKPAMSGVVPASATESFRNERRERSSRVMAINSLSGQWDAWCQRNACSKDGLRGLNRGLASRPLHYNRSVRIATRGARIRLCRRFHVPSRISVLGNHCVSVGEGSSDRNEMRPSSLGYAQLAPSYLERPIRPNLR